MPKLKHKWLITEIQQLRDDEHCSPQSAVRSAGYVAALADIEAKINRKASEINFRKLRKVKDKAAKRFERDSKKRKMKNAGIA